MSLALLYNQGKIISMKKTIIYFLIASVLFSFSTVKELTPSDTGSSIKFVIKNFGTNVDGSFKGLQGKINFDAANPGATSINISADANSINTGIKLRDTHLRKEEYFDVAKYPRISFTSTKISAGSTAGSYQATGKFTIKNITKDISFPFTAESSDNGVLFKSSFKINRRDFGVGGNSAVMSDFVTINLSVLAK